MATKLGKQGIVIYIDSEIHRQVKVYAAETCQDMKDVLKPLVDEFTQGILKLVSEVKELKQKAEQKRLEEEEIAKISAENPLKVTGIPVEPITEIIDPQTC